MQKIEFKSEDEIVVDGELFTNISCACGYHYGYPRPKNAFCPHCHPEKEKPVYVDVPKEIEFCSVKDVPLCLKISSDRFLWFDDGKWQSTTIWANSSLSRVDCVLVPCKREDLKAGEWAFWANAMNADPTGLTEIWNYALCLGGEKMVTIAEPDYYATKQGYLWIHEGETNNKGYWFRVVPKLEVKK